MSKRKPNKVKTQSKKSPAVLNSGRKIVKSENILPVSSNTKAVDNKNEPTLFKKIANISDTAWAFISVFLSLTGYTVFSILPGVDFELKKIEDQTTLNVEIKNKSFAKMKDVKPVIYVNELVRDDGYAFKPFQTMMKQTDEPLNLSGHQKYTIFQPLDVYFKFERKPEFIKAAMAVVVTYDFLWFDDLEDILFVQCRPDYHGGYIWEEVTPQDYVAKMKAEDEVKQKAGIKPKLEDSEVIRMLMDSVHH